MIKNVINRLRCVFVFLVLFSSCIQSPENIPTVNLGSETNYLIVADTIINDIVIKNPNNDEWLDHTLRKLNKKLLVNNIFESVYSGELIPYEFFNGNPLSIDEVKVLENMPEFERDKIGKVQFEEAWYYDKENKKMVKKVHSIMLAYEIYNSFGEIKGYKPAFKVKFN